MKTEPGSLQEGCTLEQNGKTTGVQVIARATDVLRALEAEPGGLSLAKIAQRVSLARSTVHRIVTALEAESLVIPASPSGGYRLGPELARLAASAGGELREAVRPFIERLRHEADETVDLAVLNRDRVFFVDQVAAPHRLQALSAVGVSLPAHCTAIGKALLAGLTDEQVERLLPERLPAETSNTITDRAELLADLERVRASGVAFDREELTIGISAVGAEIRDAGGVVAALSIPVPTARFADQEERLAEMLLRTCAEVSATLGANGHVGS
ncbi:MAG: IclR family transcriptional regulator [Actinomycetota bacterium]|nr:IclR family transcriptional regulator [Actinomycetota bacterium]